MIKKSKLIYLIGFAIISISFILIVFLVLIAGGGIDTRTKLVFSSGTAEKNYDGTPLSCEDWEILNGKLKKGHTAIVSLDENRTDAGSSLNIISVSISDENGGDVTDNYNIKCQPGELRVIARILDIKSDSASKEYDGTSLTCNKYKSIKGDVLSSHKLSVQVFGERTDAGISDNAFSVTVTDAKNNDVTQNYNIGKIYGELVVTKICISISTPSCHNVYDAKPLTCKEWEYASETKILEQHKIEVVVSGSQTDVGVSKNSISEIRITEGEKNVTDNYTITYIEGDLIVTQRNIAIRSESSKKIYDGTSLTNGNWSYVSQIRLVDTHTMTVIISGTRTEIGESPNTIAEINILTRGGKDVTFNYEITLQEGSLIVAGSEADPGEPGGSDGSGGYDLNDSGIIGAPSLIPGDGQVADNGVALRVYSDSSGKIYLRYMSFGDYIGSQWEVATDYQYLIDSTYSLNYLTGIALKNAGYFSSKVSIEVLGNNYLLPYYLDTDELSYKVQTSDVKYSGYTGSVYSAYYYLYNYENEGLSMPNLGMYTELESHYYDYVKEKYLSIPTGTHEFLLEIINNDIDINTTDIISAVAQYIKNAAVYNVSYDRALDATNDIVENFLGIYKEGICQHFASAATMLYRALGIPARYVIGYVGDSKSGEWVDISAQNAHAWVEVYLSGIGWIQVEVTGAGPGFSEGDGTDEVGGTDSQSKKLWIKPVDLSIKYRNGVVLEAGNEIQGLSKLLAQGYSYNAVVTGRRTTLGIGYSTIVSFNLYNSLGIDVTDQFNFKFGKGKLHLFVKEFDIVTESKNKVYDGTPLFSAEDSYSVNGELIRGHSFKIIAVKGRQTDVGQSENYCNVTISDEFGNDVTDMYKINKNYGTLTVTARPITITSGSASKLYDGSELVCNQYQITSSEGEEPLGNGDQITIGITGSQTIIGKSQNEITLVKIINKNGKDITNNYSIQYINGWLVVKP